MGAQLVEQSRDWRRRIVTPPGDRRGNRAKRRGVNAHERGLAKANLTRDLCRAIEHGGYALNPREARQPGAVAAIVAAGRRALLDQLYI